MMVTNLIFMSLTGWFFFMLLTTGQICPVVRAELSGNKEKRSKKENYNYIILNKINLNIN